jgi:adenylate kinase family enzyme
VTAARVTRARLVGNIATEAGVSDHPGGQTWARVNVVGTSCSGKTTLARSLARELGVPHVELDALHWEPGWTAAEPDVLRARVAAAVAAERWVVDGNYSATRDLVWPRTTLIVWLNLPFGLVFRRSLTRTFARIASGEELYNGNKESVRNLLDADGIPWWVIRTHHRRRREYRELLTRPEFAHMAVVELRTTEEVASCVAEIASVVRAASSPEG